MTRMKFRANFMKILEKADTINENIEFVRVNVNFSTLKGTDGETFDTISVYIEQYEKSDINFYITSYEEYEEKTKEVLTLLDEFIEGIKEVI